MSWWGKVLGGTVGFVMGGPVGAVLGASVGHGYDTFKEEESSGILGENERVQTVFFTATFAVMGHLARADGRVSEEEARSVKEIMARMRLSSSQRQTAVNLFNEGKRPEFPLNEVLDQFKNECRGRQDIVRMFLEMLLVMARSDGELHESELRLLYHICERVGFPRTDFELMVAAMGNGKGGRSRTRSGTSEGMRLDDAYRVLGLSKADSDEELRKAYRRLIMQYHPDMLVSKGLPEEMMKFATEKTRTIKTAYDLICRKRKIN